MISVLDRLATEFRDVQRSAESVAQPFACLLPQRICKISDDDVANLCRKSPKDLSNPDALRTEIDLMSQDIQHMCPQNDLRAAAKMMCGQWQRYPNLRKAYQLALTVPITVASNERSFSRLKLVKSYLRTTMTEHRLDDIMIITCKSDIADKLELDELARSWSLLKARRIQV